jgi:hypothetical protein
VRLNDPPCTRAKYCECGYRHIVSVYDNEHVYGEDGICEVCNKAVEPTLKAEQLAIATEAFNTLKNYRIQCQEQAHLYYSAWTFIREEVQNYTTYDSFVTALSAHLNLDKEALEKEIAKIAQGSDKFVSTTKKFNTAKDPYKTIQAIEQLLIKNETHVSLTKIDKVSENLLQGMNTTVINIVNEELIQAIKDYTSQLKSFSEFVCTLPSNQDKDAEYAKYSERLTKFESSASNWESNIRGKLDV